MRELSVQAAFPDGHFAQVTVRLLRISSSRRLPVEAVPAPLALATSPASKRSPSARLRVLRLSSPRPGQGCPSREGPGLRLGKRVEEEGAGFVCFHLGAGAQGLVVTPAHLKD